MRSDRSDREIDPSDLCRRRELDRMVGLMDVGDCEREGVIEGARSRIEEGS